MKVISVVGVFLFGFGLGIRIRDRYWGNHMQELLETVSEYSDQVEKSADITHLCADLVNFMIDAQQSDDLDIEAYISELNERASFINAAGMLL